MKRSAEKRDSMVAAEFLYKYFKERGMEQDAVSKPGEEIKARAEQARESFKRMRLEARGLAGSTDQMTPEDKYHRRLENNRNSAAASRVYKEVMEREAQFSLREVAKRAEEYEAQAAELKRSVDERERDIVAMRATISRLEEQVQNAVAVNAASPSKIEDAALAFDSAPTGALIGALPPLHPTSSSSGVSYPLSLLSLPARHGASQGERAHVRYGGSLPRTQSESTATAGEQGPVDIRYSVDANLQMPILSSQDEIKLETPESLDAELPTMFSQTANIK